MEFLNKLYESNYFGIGLFAVISFLVVTFLVVLFFGKKDEKRRKFESTNIDTFKETGEPIKLETSVVPTTPVAPINSVEPVAPVAPINYDVPGEPVNAVSTSQINIEPVGGVINKTTPIVENVAPVSPIINEPTPIINEEVIHNASAPVTPSINEPVTPIITEPVTPIITEAPVTIEPVKIDIPVQVEQKVMEPIKITIPEEPIVAPAPVIEPVIKEEVKPIIAEPTITEVPAINDTYYKPVEKVEIEDVKVPNIDFDAIAESISKELDELEKSTIRSNYEEVKITPMSEINKPSNQFSSVYVNTPIATPTSEPIDLPKRIDLPTKKENEIEPESYNI